jgi:hypothetical protein
LWLKLEYCLAGELAVNAKLYFVASLNSILHRDVPLRMQRKEKLLSANLSETVFEFL